MSKEHHRHSVRLPGVDYSVPGHYFVTICVKNRSCLFGEIKDGSLSLNKLGEIARQCWENIPNHYQNVVMDEFIVMPNHVHGILQIIDADNLGVQNIEPLRQTITKNCGVGAQYFVPHLVGRNKYQHIIPGSVGSIIRGYKIGVTKWWRNNGYVGELWQKNYYEHIIRNDKSLNNIRRYIKDNVLNWAADEENPLTCLKR